MRELPPRETWEAGNSEAEKVANECIGKWELEQKIAINESGLPTQREVQLSVSILCLRRQVAEQKGDMMNAAIYASRVRAAMMMGNTLTEKDKRIAMEALGKIEGKGRKIAEGWLFLESVLKQWCVPTFWAKDVKPWVEAQAVSNELKRRG